MNVNTAISETPIPSAADRMRSSITPRIDYLNPPGAPALYAPDSIAWRVYKNPLTVMIGGITAVLLELAEPRVRTGVWEHSVFRTDPLARVRRTGVATLATIYAPEAAARRLIANVGRMHARVGGHTPDGVAYRADDVELLDWVQATVDFGFMEAYSAYGSRLTDEERSTFYFESQVSARLFGATGKPASLAAQQALFERMTPRLEPHPIILEFLGIVSTLRILPAGLGWLQRMVIRAGVDLLPSPVLERLELGPRWRTRAWERAMLKAIGWVFERAALPGTPPVQACRRVGLPARNLFSGRRRPGGGV